MPWDLFHSVDFRFLGGELRFEVGSDPYKFFVFLPLLGVFVATVL